MNFKKIVSVFLACLMLLTSFAAVSADEVSFPDLGEGHWAYSAVMQLVADGTVNGMDDGTYAPDKLVTRAEFAKMIGKTETRKEADFADLDSSHWSYEYVMWSGIEGDADGNFRPNEPMLRDDVVYALWQRNGAPDDVTAPSVVTGQSKNSTAAAWAYTYGLMIGDDGVDLRLNDGISRAEVASLIVRSRNLGSAASVNFVDTASDEVLKAVFEGSNAFDVEYSADATITNGELARAALRIASEEYSLRYSQFTVDEPFQHEYVKDLYAMGTACIGTDKITAEFIDKPANNLDMVSMLTFALIKKSNKSIVYDTSNTCYKDVADMQKNTAYTCLAYANGNGVQLYADGSIKPDETATLKSVASVLLQLDYLVGIMSCYETNGESYNEIDVALNHNADDYPEGKTNFAYILNGIPSEVYNTTFAGMQAMDGSFGRNPVAVFEFARDFRSLFLQLILREEAKVEADHGISLKYTYYPSLVADNTHGFTSRLKIEIESVNNKELTYGDVFKLGEGVDGSAKLYDGMVFFADADMPYELGSYPDTASEFGNIVCIVK